MTTPEEGMVRLLRASATGALDEPLTRHRVRLLTVFGSSARKDPDPADLDVGVSFETGHRPDLLGLLSDLYAICGREVDLAVVDGASPLLRDRALMHAEPVWESEPGVWVNEAVTAHLEAMDTAWLRRLDLERMAAG